MHAGAGLSEKGLQEGWKKALPLSSEPREAAVTLLELGHGLTELQESVQVCLSVTDDSPTSCYPNALHSKSLICLYSWLPSRKVVSFCLQIPKYRVIIFFWPNMTEWTTLKRAYFLCFGTKGSFPLGRIGQALKGLRDSPFPCLPANPSPA